MAFNLFISYDLMNEKNYPAVMEKIESLGRAFKIEFSLWYLKTDKDHNEVAKSVRSAMDTDDRLIVIDASHAAWYNLEEGASEFIQKHWNS